MESVHILIFPGFADWEPAYALAELRRSGERNVVAIGFDLEPVTSMGGLRVIPDQALKEISPSEMEILIIPGGEFWEGVYDQEQLDTALTSVAASAVPVAAICAGTLPVARAGLLNDRRHTSNMPGYLSQHCSAYTGDARYERVPAVNDRGVITASGLASVEFASEIFKELNIFSSADGKAWFDMFRSGHIRLDAF